MASVQEIVDSIKGTAIPGTRVGNVAVRRYQDLAYYDPSTHLCQLLKHCSQDDTGQLGTCYSRIFMQVQQAVRIRYNRTLSREDRIPEGETEAFYNGYPNEIANGVEFARAVKSLADCPPASEEVQTAMTQLIQAEAAANVAPSEASEAALTEARRQLRTCREGYARRGESGPCRYVLKKGQVCPDTKSGNEQVRRKSKPYRCRRPTPEGHRRLNGKLVMTKKHRLSQPCPEGKTRSHTSGRCKKS